MPWLQATHIRLGLEEYELTSEGAQINIISHIIDELFSDSDLPANRIEVGKGTEIKAIILNAYDPGGFFKSKQVTEHLDIDVCLSVTDPDKTGYWYLTNMQLIQNWDLAFKNERLYLPVTLQSTDNTEMVWARYETLMTPEIENLLTPDGEEIEILILEGE